MSQPTPQQTHVDGYGSKPSKKARKRAKKLRAAGLTKSEFDVLAKLWKNDEQQIVYGVVLEPDLHDSQHDTVGTDEIEKAAHLWLRESRRHDIQHSEEAAGCFPVESYIAPVAFELETPDGPQPVTKGSWVVAIKVEDPKIWKEVKKGKLTGLSMGGSALRLSEDD